MYLYLKTLKIKSNTSHNANYDIEKFYILII